MENSRSDDGMAQRQALYNLERWGASIDTPADDRSLLAPSSSEAPPAPLFAPPADLLAGSAVRVSDTLPDIRNTTVGPTLHSNLQPGLPPATVTPHNRSVSVAEHFRDSVNAQLGTDAARFANDVVAQAATITHREILHPFTARPSVAGRFLEVVRDDAEIFQAAHQATGDQRFAVPIEDLKRRSTAVALTTLRLLSGETLAQTPAARTETTELNSPAIRVREATTSTRGLRRLFSKLRRHRR